MPHVISLNVDAIKNRFDVRKKLDQDRVIQFAVAYEAGEKMPPVKVVRLEDGTYAYVDGRHRGQAVQYLGRKSIEAIVLSGSLKDNLPDLYAEALHANWGGSLPPTRDDIVHTVVRMLENGASQAQVGRQLNFLPAGALRNYVMAARSVLLKGQFRRAKIDLANGLTVEQAAKRQGMSLETLKSRLKGGKGLGDANSELELRIAYKQHVARQIKSMTASINGKVQHMMQQVEDGELLPKSAHEILNDYRDRLRRNALAIEDWQARLVELEGPVEKSA